MDKHDFLEKQLDSYYHWIIKDKSQSVTTRCWCFTVWIVSVTLIASNKVDLNPLKIIIIILPVLFFWILDGLHNSFIDLNERCAKKIEQLIVLDEIDKVDLGEYLLISNHDNTPLISKLKAFFVCLFLRETVFFFYAMLLVVSIFVLFIIQ